MSSTNLAAAAESELAELEQLWQTMDLPGHRVELIGGQIVVSPTAGRSHSNSATQLVYRLGALAERNGWEIHTALTAHIPATRERLIPDVMVVPADAPGFGDEEVLSPGILLVAEIVSPSSRRQDRETKPRAYAQGGVPLYLLVDRFAEPPAVTLFSRPGPDGYQSARKATARQPLLLPEPFDVELDPARLLA